MGEGMSKEQETVSDLYEYPEGYVGRKKYVSVRGHSRSIPAYKTYKGFDGYNYLAPEYGGNLDGYSKGSASTFVMPDKAGYVSPIDGKMVEGRVAHAEHMRKHDVIEVGDAPMGTGVRDLNAMPAGMRDDIRRAMSELNA